jgi:hypothetical protein
MVMRVGQLLLVLAVGVSLGAARADDPKPKPLTPEQQARLKERDRQAAEAQAPWGKGEQVAANEEIAGKLTCTPRTIERKVRLIRTIWEKEGAA